MTVTQSKLKKFFIILLIIGVLLHVYTVVFKAEGGLNEFTFGLLIWSLCPYLFVWGILFKLGWYLQALCSLTLILCLDFWMHFRVFMYPQTSTDGLGLLWTPLWNLIVCIPVGVFIGWMIQRKRA